MKNLALTLLSIPAVLAPMASRATEPSPRDLHVAQCVAALDSNTQDLADRVRSGQQSSRRMLEDRLVAGAAFIGDSYLRGKQDEQQARELANRELEAQKNLPAAELSARQDACAGEGTKLFAAGNKLQQAVVQRLAKKRMDKLLAGG